MHYGTVSNLPSSSSSSSSSSSQAQTTVVPDEDLSPDTPPPAEREHRRKKPSSLWMLPIVFFFGLSRGVTVAPRIDVYTQIACDELHMNTPVQAQPLHTLWFHTPSAPITSPPVHSRIKTNLTVNITDDSSYLSTHAEAIPKECLDDPVVHSRAAQIQATLGTIVGILSIVTAGYWGQISDAYGRKTVISTVLFGMVFHHVIYILVDTPDTVFNRHAWKFLVLGPFVEGILGGITTYHAAENAFLADCANSGSRSTVFAYFQGVSYIALASGPQIAPLLLKNTTTNPRTPMFYAGLGLETLGFLYALLALPETVSKETMLAARNMTSSQLEEETFVTRSVRAVREMRDKLLSPLRIFAPKKLPGGGWEYSMTLIVVAQFIHLLSAGVVQVKYLYAQHTYAWTVKQLGYYISLLWILRAFHLLLLLPTILRYIRPKRSLETRKAIMQDLKFDCRVAQVSIFIDISAYILTLISPTSAQVLFICFTSLSSFTSGANPAIHALAVSYLLAFHNDQNVGRMFGGMSMLQAISNTLQPILFGFIYSETTGTFPKAIFAVAAALLITTSLLFMLLRTDVRVIEKPSEEETRVFAEEPDLVANDEDVHRQEESSKLLVVRA